MSRLDANNTRLVRRRIAFALFILAWVTYIDFFNAGGSTNVVSRLALTVSLVESHEVSIDPYAPHTLDKAHRDGHYYSDKAPGIAFLSIPAVIGGRALFDTFIPEQDRYLGYPWFKDEKLSYRWNQTARLATIMTSAFLTALAVAALFSVGAAMTGSLVAGLFGALLFGFATPAWGWATTLFGHASAGALLVLTFATLYQVPAAAESSPPRGVLRSALAAFMAAAAITVEYTSAPAAGLLAVYGYWRLRTLPPRRRLLMVCAAVAAGGVALAPLLIYHQAAFGSPFATGYQFVVGFEGMAEGLLGIGVPDPWRLGMILFSGNRGLLWISPILILSPVAFYALWRRHNTRDIALLTTAMVAYYFLLNAGYVYWDGGWSTGPRHVTPVFGFLCLPFAMLWSQARRPLRAALVVLAALSVVISMACAAVTMIAKPGKAPLIGHYIGPPFLNGQIPGVTFDFGLPGLAALVPLLAVWAIAGLYLWHMLARAPSTAR
ncbi:MAG: hypothetical protein GY791_15710 [Alphaproteobacteria bacterium]|nr:hypothetical protein [Alphaproteobacteria bacterium]